MKILIAAGGTGGHINPGLAMAQRLKIACPEVKVSFVGTKTGLETELIPRAGFEIFSLNVRGFRRKLSIDTITALGLAVYSFFQAALLLIKLKPDLVIGTGGYVCGPVLSACVLLKIPTLLHESNALPGVTTRLLSRWVDCLAVSFEETVKHLPAKAKVHITGSPIRHEILTADREKARKILGIDKNQRLVVVFFGSLGASTLNEVMIDLLREYSRKLGFRLIYGTGKRHYKGVLSRLGDVLPRNAEVFPYIGDMDLYMAAADVAVCRSGAMTVGELCVLGVPSILIPSPYVADNHQEFNARSLESKGAATVILEKNLSAELLFEKIQQLLTNDEERQRMSNSAFALGKKDGIEKITGLIKVLLKKGESR